MSEAAEIKVFSDPEEVSRVLAYDIVELIKETINKNGVCNIALSGGSTPGQVYKVLAERCSDSDIWQNTFLFWGDERCVEPDNQESNYGMSRSMLIDKINIPDTNIHRIRGEENPINEAERYSELLSNKLRLKDGFPVFDLILLGIGEDGHTASIFPDRMELLISDKICVDTRHPLSGQNRISLSGKTINSAKNIWFSAFGSNKSKVVADILRLSEQSLTYPAASIIPFDGILTWYLDKNSSADYIIES